jgi:hypothetical protein
MSEATLPPAGEHFMKKQQGIISATTLSIDYLDMSPQQLSHQAYLHMTMSFELIAARTEITV